MLSYRVPENAYKRIILNDKSQKFKIIFKIKNRDDHIENISIEKHSQVMISTTANKARIISKTIDETYLNDPSLNQFEFEINNDLNNQEITIEEIAETIKLIIESIENQVNVPESKRSVFSQIINILNEEKSKVTLNIKQSDDENPEHIKPNLIIFECDFEGDELSGIISCIKQMTGNNAIKLSCGGTEDKEYPLTNIINYSSDHINDHFYNFLMPLKYDEGWIEFDFLHRKINVTSYTIRTSGNYAYHPKSWQIVGSNDRLNWNIIDNQIENFSLNGKFKQHRFSCEKNNQFYQYIRYVALDTYLNTVYNNSICLTCIEFFGAISTPEQ